MGSQHTKLGKEPEVVLDQEGAWVRNGEEQSRYEREVEVQRRVVEQWRQWRLTCGKGTERMFVQLKPDYIAAESIPALIKGDNKTCTQTSNLSSSVLNKFIKFVSPVTQMVCITSRSLISLNSDKKHFERLLFGLRTCKIIRFTRFQFKQEDFAHLSLIKDPQIEHLSFCECKLTNTKFQPISWKNILTKICHSPLQKSLIWIGLYQIPKIPLTSSKINSIGISQD